MLYIILQLVLVSSTSAAHYYGGVMTFTPKGRNPDGSLRVDFRYKESYHSSYCYPQHIWFCSNGNCGSNSRHETGQLDSSVQGSYSDIWCQSETLITKSIPTDTPFEMRETSCCWVFAENNYGSWNLLTYVDLGTRSDTRKANTSPVSTSVPLIRIPQNCPRRVNLLAHDPDGDHVRCRYGTIQYVECGTCYQHPDFHLDERSCTLDYKISSAFGAYTFEMVLEDFPTQPITLHHMDGTSTVKSPLLLRRSQPSYTQTTVPPFWNQASSPTSLPYNYMSSFTAWQQNSSVPAHTSNASQAKAAQWWQHPFTSSTTSTAAPATAPLSKIPLQFIVQVNSAVPSCTEGEYIPQFLYPTPRNGEYLRASVGQDLEFRINATAIYAEVRNILISGPLNITKQVSFHDNIVEAVVKWTPTENDLGDHVPICFIAEGEYGNDSQGPTDRPHFCSLLGGSKNVDCLAGSSKGAKTWTSCGYNTAYDSEMRCIIVTVGQKFGEAYVICNEVMMTVEVEKSSLPGIHEDHLHLKDPSCTLTSNVTHLISTVSLNTCGTEMEEDNENIIFKNEIVSFENGLGVITRKNEVRIGFSCVYPKKGNVSFEFRAHKVPYVFTEKGFGTFTYQFEFFRSNLFSSMVDPKTYPVEVNLDQMIYMEILATATLPNTQLFVETCKATPYDDPNYPIFYSIIENGCAVDDTIAVYQSRQTEYRFGMKAFKFIGLHDEVFISCSVMLCRAGYPATRCFRGCVNGTNASISHHHRKRAAIAETSRHHISQGPLRLKRNSFATDSSMNVNLNSAFIAGVLLVAVGMVCGAVIYRKKESKVKYQSLPSHDF